MPFYSAHPVFPAHTLSLRSTAPTAVKNARESFYSGIHAIPFNSDSYFSIPLPHFGTTFENFSTSGRLRQD